MDGKRKTGSRVGFDARGLARWEEPVAPGQYQATKKESQLTRLLKADELSLAETRRYRILQNNPYANASVTEKPLKTRSRLDYMRALSEAIKTKRRLNSGNGS